MLEREPLSNLVKKKEVVAFRHKKFWQCMDTIRDKRYYKKPSEIRQEKLKEQRRNMQKSQREKARDYGIRYKNYDPNASKQRG